MITIQIRVISKNVRYATKDPFPGEELWSIRRDLLINELRFNTLHNQSAFICCQEVLYEQLQDIIAGLREFDDWDYVGWGRDDGKTAGEYSPIFFRSNVWHVVEKDAIWLSPTPQTPSKDPDAGSIRILTTAKFRHAQTGALVTVYCTHLDNASSSARKRAADQIVDLVSADHDTPLLLAGDFNSEVNQEAYQTLLQSGLFIDVSSVKDDVKYGNSNTFTGFGSDDDPPSRIDYIFHSNISTSNRSLRFRVQDYAVLCNRFDNGIFNSDHRAVVADLVLQSV